MQSERSGAVYADAVVFPERGALRVGPGLVRWHDGIIIEVRSAARQEIEEIDGLVDLGRCALAPAWVNAHTHLAMSALRGVGGDAARRGNVVEDLWFRIEAGLERDDVRAFARIGALECLITGTGAVFDHYYHADAVAEALVDVGLMGMVAPTLQDLSGPGARGWREALDLTETLDARADLQQAGVVVALGPHASDTVSDALWERVVEIAERRQLPVHVHVAQSPEEVERALAFGASSPIDRLIAGGRLDAVPRTLLVHGIYTTKLDIERLDPARFIHVHCPASQAQFAFPADLARWSRVPIALGTDAGACNDGMDIQRELLLLGHVEAWRTSFDPATIAALDGALADGLAAIAAHRRSVFDARLERSRPESVLRAVWAVPGSVHPRLDVGRIAVGARANLAAWNLDHPAFWPGKDPLRSLAFGAVGPALDTLWVGGAVVGERGDVGAVLRRPQVRAWIDEADRRLAALIARTNGA